MVKSHSLFLRRLCYTIPLKKLVKEQDFFKAFQKERFFIQDSELKMLKMLFKWPPFSLVFIVSIFVNIDAILTVDAILTDGTLIDKQESVYESRIVGEKDHSPNIHTLSGKRICYVLIILFLAGA